MPQHVRMDAERHLGGRRNRFGTTPLPQKLPIAPIFIADRGSLAVSRKKDGKLRLVYAGWDASRSSCLARRHWLRETVSPFMTVGPDPPPWVIYGEPSTPLAKLVGDGGAVQASSHLLSNDRYARCHGKVTFPTATSRREKVRCLSTGSSMTAQSRRSSRSFPPLMAQRRPALPRYISG
jgi:hypothetical protein